MADHIVRIGDYELEGNLNNELVGQNNNELNGAMENLDLQEALPGPVQEIEGNGQLGLEPQPDVDPQVDEIMQDNEDVGSPSVINPRSPQDSPGSRSSTNVRNDQMDRASDLFMAVSISADTNRTRITDLATAAMDELSKMAIKGEPLWQRKGNNNGIEVLNGFEYMREFGSLDATLEDIIRMVEVGEPQCLECSFDLPFGAQDMPSLPEELGIETLNIEASREVGLVSMNPISLVELFMDLNQWLLAFSNIVSRAMLIGVLSTGEAANYDGKLQVMTAEFHLPTALVPTRESYFARYCKQLSHGTWAVVDVSLESLFPCPLVRFRRRPSGCLIQEMPNGFSKVIWVENVEVDNISVHRIFKPLISSGFAFSATRWVATIIRHCEELETLMARSTPTHDGILIQQAGRESLLKLSDRMMRRFCQDVNASKSNAWMPLPISGGEDIRVMTRDIKFFAGKPPSNTLAFTTSIWLPTSPKKLFDFLCDENARTQWDMLSYQQIIRELAYVVNGKNPENRVSIVQANYSPNQIAILYLQKSYKDETGSYVIYSPMDIFAMSMLLNGGNPDYVTILASGFAILPDNKPSTNGENINGSILTIAFHIMDSNVNSSTDEDIPPSTVHTIHKVITTTAVLIEAAVVADDQPAGGSSSTHPAPSNL